jgi:mono/diheme cytochrome c family protein
MLREWRRSGRSWIQAAALLGIAVLVLGAWAASAEGGPALQEASANQGGWDGRYTEAQAERGKTVYEQQCAFCHLSDMSGQGFAPPLIEDTFMHRWQDGNLGDLFTVVKVTMPQDKPASLTDAEYAEIVAYMLQTNKYTAGSQELSSDPADLKGIIFQRPGAAAKP